MSDGSCGSQAGRLDHMSSSKDAQEKVRKQLQAAKGPTKQARWQPNKKESIYSLSRGC
jgi:hypothetical protein